MIPFFNDLQGCKVTRFAVGLLTDLGGSRTFVAGNAAPPRLPTSEEVERL